jgi:hypothetical protein
MSRLRAIAIEEQRQLITFGFAIVVFLLTLLALQLRAGGSIPDPVGSASGYAASHAMDVDGGASPGNWSVALAAVPSTIEDSNARNRGFPALRYEWSAQSQYRSDRL